MAKPKGDLEIGYRMYQECYRIFGTGKKAAEQMQITKNSVYEWKLGRTPCGLALARLHSFGGDVLYVLTGKREPKMAELKPYLFGGCDD